MMVNSPRSMMNKDLQEANDQELIKNEDMLTPEIRYHGKIDWDVAKRFLEALYNVGEIRKTNLAMRAGVNYVACTRYVEWLTEINWVVIKSNNYVKLTESGLQMCEHLLIGMLEDKPRT